MKKIISVILAVIMVALNLTTFAAPYSSNEPQAEEMEKLIAIVKPKLDIPEICSEFDWYYNSGSYYRNSTWNFTWYDDDYTAYYSVTCDSEGNILNYYYNNWNSWDEEPKSRLPAYTKSELKTKADEYFKKLRPDAFSHMQLTNSYSEIYSRNFVYEYTRFEDGVEVPEETARVSVDYSDGELVNFSINFNRSVSFGKKDNTGLEKAKELIKGEQKMKLYYRTKRDYESGEVKAYLVYSPEIGYISVNAETGEICLERNTWNVQTEPRDSGKYMSENASMDMDLAESEGAGEYKLTEEERAQVDLLDSLISKEEAIQAVKGNKYLYINEDATAVDAYLTKYNSYYYYRNAGDEEDNYVWRVNFSAPYRNDNYEEMEKTGFFSPYMNATVDAKTGAIISFYSNVPYYKYYVNDYRKIAIPSLKYDEDSARAVFEEFLDETIPDKFGLSRFTGGYDGVVIDYKNPDKYEDPVYRTKSLHYVRVNEGIDYDYNSISGTMDLVTGKITSFSYNWYDNVEFESPKDAISPEEALDVLLNDEGFGLNYEINSNYTYNQYLIDMEEKENYNIDELYETEQYSRLVYSGYNYYSTDVAAL
ncbi:MAG: hypothetical protein J5844_03435, partial [Clostridia bacterium]|nr:hypothetical protein [Clostridia bacterium]